MSWRGSVWVHLVWHSLCFPYLDIYFLLQVQKVFSHNFIKYIFDPFLSLFFWDPCNANVSMLDVLPEIPQTVLILKICFSFCCSDWVIFIILSSRLLMCSLSPSVLLIPSSAFFISGLDSSVLTGSFLYFPVSC